MTIDQHQPSIREFTGDERISVPDFREQSVQGSGLLFWMTMPSIVTSQRRTPSQLLTRCASGSVGKETASLDSALINISRVF
jgi:hypothetical protein